MNELTVDAPVKKSDTPKGKEKTQRKTSAPTVTNPDYQGDDVDAWIKVLDACSETGKRAPYLKESKEGIDCTLGPTIRRLEYAILDYRAPKNNRGKYRMLLVALVRNVWCSTEEGKRVEEILKLFTTRVWIERRGANISAEENILEVTNKAKKELYKTELLGLLSGFEGLLDAVAKASAADPFFINIEKNWKDFAKYKSKAPRFFICNSKQIKQIPLQEHDVDAWIKVLDEYSELGKMAPCLKESKEGIECTLGSKTRRFEHAMLHYRSITTQRDEHYKLIIALVRNIWCSVAEEKRIEKVLKLFTTRVWMDRRNVGYDSREECILEATNNLKDDEHRLELLGVLSSFEGLLEATVKAAAADPFLINIEIWKNFSTYKNRKFSYPISICTQPPQNNAEDMADHLSIPSELPPRRPPPKVVSGAHIDDQVNLWIKDLEVHSSNGVRSPHLKDVDGTINWMLDPKQRRIENAILYYYGLKKRHIYTPLVVALVRNIWCSAEKGRNRIEKVLKIFTTRVWIDRSNVSGISGEENILEALNKLTYPLSRSDLIELLSDFEGLLDAAIPLCKDKEGLQKYITKYRTKAPRYFLSDPSQELQTQPVFSYLPAQFYPSFLFPPLFMQPNLNPFASFTFPQLPPFFLPPMQLSSSLPLQDSSIGEKRKNDVKTHGTDSAKKRKIELNPAMPWPSASLEEDPSSFEDVSSTSSTVPMDLSVVEPVASVAAQPDLNTNLDLCAEIHAYTAQKKLFDVARTGLRGYLDQAIKENDANAFAVVKAWLHNRWVYYQATYTGRGSAEEFAKRVIVNFLCAEHASKPSLDIFAVANTLTEEQLANAKIHLFALADEFAIRDLLQEKNFTFKQWIEEQNPVLAAPLSPVSYPEMEEEKVEEKNATNAESIAGFVKKFGSDTQIIAWDPKIAKPELAPKESKFPVRSRRENKCLGVLIVEGESSPRRNVQSYELEHGDAVEADVRELLQEDSSSFVTFVRSKGPKLLVAHTKTIGGYGVLLDADEFIGKDTPIGKYSGKPGRIIKKDTPDPNTGTWEYYDLMSTGIIPEIVAEFIAEKESGSFKKTAECHELLEVEIIHDLDTEIKKQLGEVDADSYNELKNRVKIRLKRIKSYAFTSSVGEKSDAVIMADEAGCTLRYINDGGKPNVYAKIIDGEVWLFAAEDLQGGTSLSISYGPDYWGDIEPQPLEPWENGQTPGDLLDANAEFYAHTPIDLANGLKAFVPTEDGLKRKLPFVVVERCEEGWLVPEAQAPINPLVYHCRNGNVAEVKRLLRFGYNERAKTEAGSLLALVATNLKDAARKEILDLVVNAIFDGWCEQYIISYEVEKERPELVAIEFDNYVSKHVTNAALRDQLLLNFKDKLADYALKQLQAHLEYEECDFVLSLEYLRTGNMTAEEREEYGDDPDVIEVRKIFVQVMGEYLPAKAAAAYLSGNDFDEFLKKKPEVKPEATAPAKKTQRKRTARRQTQSKRAKTERKPKRARDAAASKKRGPKKSRKAEAVASAPQAKRRKIQKSREIKIEVHPELLYEPISAPEEKVTGKKRKAAEADEVSAMLNPAEEPRKRSRIDSDSETETDSSSASDSASSSSSDSDSSSASDEDSSDGDEGEKPKSMSLTTDKSGLLEFIFDHIERGAPIPVTKLRKYFASLKITLDPELDSTGKITHESLRLGMVAGHNDGPNLDFFEIASALVYYEFTMMQKSGDFAAAQDKLVNFLSEHRYYPCATGKKPPKKINASLLANFLQFVNSLDRKNGNPSDPKDFALWLVNCFGAKVANDLCKPFQDWSNREKFYRPNPGAVSLAEFKSAFRKQFNKRKKAALKKKEEKSEISGASFSKESSSKSERKVAAKKMRINGDLLLAISDLGKKRVAISPKELLKQLGLFDTKLKKIPAKSSIAEIIHECLRLAMSRGRNGSPNIKIFIMASALAHYQFSMLQEDSNQMMEFMNALEYYLRPGMKPAAKTAKNGYTSFLAYVNSLKVKEDAINRRELALWLVNSFGEEVFQGLRKDFATWPEREHFSRPKLNAIWSNDLAQFKELFDKHDRIKIVFSQKIDLSEKSQPAFKLQSSAVGEKPKVAAGVSKGDSKKSVTVNKTSLAKPVSSLSTASSSQGKIKKPEMKKKPLITAKPLPPGKVVSRPTLAVGVAKSQPRRPVIPKKSSMVIPSKKTISAPSKPAPARVAAKTLGQQGLLKTPFKTPIGAQTLAKATAFSVAKGHL